MEEWRERGMRAAGVQMWRDSETDDPGGYVNSVCRFAIDGRKLGERSHLKVAIWSKGGVNAGTFARFRRGTSTH